MKIVYDSSSDVIHIYLRNTPIDQSASLAPNITADLDRNGNITTLEIAQASQCVHNPRNVEFMEVREESEEIAHRFLRTADLS